MQSGRSPEVLLVGLMGGTGGASAVMLDLAAQYSLTRMVTEHLDCYAQGVRANGLSGTSKAHA